MEVRKGSNDGDRTGSGGGGGGGALVGSSGGVGVRHTEYLLRKAPPPAAAHQATQPSAAAGASPLKEKFVSIYEQLFYQGIEGVNPEENATFWDELFLLRVNASFLERCVILTGEEQLLQMRTTLQAIFTNTSLYLHDQSKIRVAHALETLCILLRSLFRKKFSSFGLTSLVVLATEETARDQFVELLSTLSSIILGVDEMPSTEPFRRLALTALLIIATATEQINDNPFLPFFMEVNLFDLIVQLLACKDVTIQSDALFLFSILLSFHGHDAVDNWNSTNSYRACVRAMTFAQSQAIQAALVNSLNGVNQTYQGLLHEPKQNASVLSRWLSGWFSASSEDPYLKISNYSTGATLLVLYHCSNLSPRSLHQFEHDEEAEATLCEILRAEEKKLAELDLNLEDSDDEESEREGKESECGSQEGQSPDQGGSEQHLMESQQNVERAVTQNETAIEENQVNSAKVITQGDSGNLHQTSSDANELSETQQPAKDVKPIHHEPPDILVKFITFAAYLLPDMRDQRQAEYGQLCLRTLLRLTEYKGINRILHDPQIMATLPLYRKTSTTKSLAMKNQSLACALIDSMICVMRSNLKRQLPSRMFCPCLNIIRRLIIYQKAEGISLEKYNWSELWACLLSLVKIIVSSERKPLGERRMSVDRIEDSDAPEAEIVSENLIVAEQLVLLLNIFITFGPRIFPSVELEAAPPSAAGTASSLSSSFSTIPSTPAPSSSSSSPSTSSSNIPTVLSSSMVAAVPTQRSQGYGSFAAAPLPLYRTLPTVDIPAYFQLFYEIIHNSSLFRSFVEWASHRNPVLMHRLDNVSNIIIHFTAKVDEWYVDHPDQTIFAEQVMEIIRENYPTLHLASTPELTSDKVFQFRTDAEEEEQVNKLTKALIFDCRAVLTIAPIPEAIFGVAPVAHSSHEAPGGE